MKFKDNYIQISCDGGAATGKSTGAKIIAKKPKMLELLKILSEEPAKAAIIAPTIITEDIAFVTDINGVCKDGVTLHTT